MSSLEKINNLLERLSVERASLEKYISDLDQIKDELVKKIALQRIDIRQKNALDEKLKIINNFYYILLSFKQEINKLLINEIEIRRKLLKDDVGNVGVISDNDIRKVLEKIELTKSDYGNIVNNIREAVASL